MKSKKLGEEGEKLACRFLVKKGYRILKRNCRSSLGEIDVVARDGQVLVFVEVKTRQNRQYGSPQEAVTVKKQDKMRKLALAYMKNYKYRGDCRFDVVSVLADLEQKTAKVKLLKDAF